MTVSPGASRLKVLVAEYDFAVDGGAIGNITLRQAGGGTIPNSVPSGAVIVGGYIEVLTTCTSGGAATIGLNSEAAGDLKATATGVGTYAAGIVSVVPTWGTSAVKTTAARSVVMAIGAATLTAGKFRVVVFYR